MLINLNLANKHVATEFGHITFNEMGENNELTVEQQQKLGALPGFTYLEDKKEPKKEEPKKEEKKDEKKAPAKSKAAAKKEDKK